MDDVFAKRELPPVKTAIQQVTEPHMLLAFDPGLLCTGWVVLRVTRYVRTFVGAGTIRTEVEQEDDQRIAVIAGNALRLLERFRPTIIGFEAYRWQGQSRSANFEAFRMSRVVGRLEGVAQTWADRDPTTRRWLLSVDKSAANRAIGINGKAPKRRVQTFVEALFPSARLRNEHERDAVAVAVAVHRRWAVLSMAEFGKSGRAGKHR